MQQAIAAVLEALPYRPTVITANIREEAKIAYDLLKADLLERLGAEDYRELDLLRDDPSECIMGLEKQLKGREEPYYIFIENLGVARAGSGIRDAVNKANAVRGMSEMSRIVAPVGILMYAGAAEMHLLNDIYSSPLLNICNIVNSSDLSLTPAGAIDEGKKRYLEKRTKALYDITLSVYKDGAELDIPQAINLYGANSSGKSTCARAICTMLQATHIKTSYLDFRATRDIKDIFTYAGESESLIVDEADGNNLSSQSLSSEARQELHSKFKFVLYVSHSFDVTLPRYRNFLLETEKH
ncbi:MAG: AAA family ATPase [Nanoarchaeota archaeon]|nr:AAA family ATPase [Nanoarchaeota archaeon]